MQKYTVNEGLSGTNIHHISQDKFGFLWISTQDGLNRTGGKNFIRYTNAEIPQRKTLSMDIRMALPEPKTGHIWVLNSLKGFTEIEPLSGNVIRNLETSQPDSDAWNIVMDIAKNNFVVGSHNGLLLYDTHTGKQLPSPNLPFTKNKKGDLFTVRTLCAEKNRVWVGVNNYGMVSYDPVTFHLQDIIPFDQFCETTAMEISFTCILPLAANTWLIGTSEGLKKVIFHHNGWHVIHNPIPGNCPINSEPMAAALRCGSGFFFASEKGLYQSDSNLSSYVHLTETLDSDEGWLRNINCLFADNEENLWLGCKQGLARVNAASFAFSGINNKEYPDSKLNQVYFVKPENQNFLIGMEHGLTRYLSPKGTFEVLGNSLFNFIFNDHCGNTIVSAREGLCLLEGSDLVPARVKFPELDSLKGICINSAVSIGDSIWLMGSDFSQGIFLWNYKSKSVERIYNESSHLKIRSNTVNKLFKDSKENIWVLSDKGIDILEKGFRKITFLDLGDFASNPPETFFDICETNHSFWITSYGHGIVQLDKQRKLRSLINARNGLSSDGVYNIFQYRNQKLIISTNNGLSVYHLRDSIFNNYYETDGLHSNSFEENCGIEENGKIFVGGLNGFTIVDPALLQPRNITPKIYFSKVVCETPYASSDTSNLLIRQLNVPSDVVRVILQFSLIYLSNPTKTKVSYKIDEVNKNWIPADGQDFISLIGMPPGSYTIRLRAANENGKWTSVIPAITLTFLPKWYQTLWFKVGMALTILMILYLLYLYRLRQIQKQNTIRKEIAGDLHDDLGSSLNTVKVFTHLARKEKDNDKYLQQIESTLTLATSGMRDMIWVLDDQNDTWQGLLERLKKFADPVLSPQHIQLVFKVNPELKDELLKKNEKKNLLLIAKEAITNAMKYANCSKITIRLDTVDRRIIFSIEDDGQGFDAQQITFGHGLKNMQYRARQIDYKLESISTLGNGTQIAVTKINKIISL